MLLSNTPLLGLLFICTASLLYYFCALDGIHTVRSHLESFNHLSSSSPGIPKLIWYKLGPHGLTNDTRNFTSTCIDANSDYTTKFLTDEAAEKYVKDAFSSRPEIIDAYFGLSVPILKADLLRYLLLYDQGGVYSDLDVSCERPIDEWIPPQYRDEAALVVGWEFDVGWGDGIVRQFASWTIMAKPRSKHMLRVIDDILSGIQYKTGENNVTVENLTLASVGDVVDFSGPRRLTFSIFKSLVDTVDNSIQPDHYKNILEPKLVGDVLIMPGQSFAAGSNTYSDEQKAQLPPALVTHHYAGSWKNDHGGEERRSVEPHPRVHPLHPF